MALDDCGGHTHGAYGYHYHSQVITAYASTGAQRGVTTGAAYAVFPPGVFKCWRVHAAAPSAEHTQSLKRASTHTRARACPDTSQYFHAFIALANAHLCVRTDTHTHHTSTQKLQMPSLAHPRAHHTLPRSQDHKQAQNRLSSLLLYTRLFFRATLHRFLAERRPFGARINSRHT